MIVLNFKRYPEATGANAVRLAVICKKLSQEFGIPIIPVPEVSDLQACIDQGIDCWTQKFEPNALNQKGTLLNHSDYRLSLKNLQEEVYLSKSRGDKVCICTQTSEETREFLRLGPDFLAYEPPELIGSETTSVAQAKPEVIGEAARACKEAGIPLLVGAGVKSAQDVVVSLNQGATGVILASAVMRAADQELEVRELAQAFRNQA